MGFRFRKRIRLAKGVYWTSARRGHRTASAAAGATVNISKKGVRSVPGTGLSDQTKRVGASGCLVLLLGFPFAPGFALFLLNQAGPENRAQEFFEEFAIKVVTGLERLLNKRTDQFE
jgi:hypothetical protein